MMYKKGDIVVGRSSNGFDFIGRCDGITKVKDVMMIWDEMGGDGWNVLLRSWRSVAFVQMANNKRKKYNLSIGNCKSVEKIETALQNKDLINHLIKSYEICEKESEMK